MLPVRAGRVSPPLQRVVERHWRRRRPEYCGTGNQLVGRDARIIPGIQGTFGHGHVLGCLDEAGEFSIGDRRAIHPETINGDEVDRQGIGHPAVATTHPERAPRYPDHSRRGGTWRGRVVDARRLRAGVWNRGRGSSVIRVRISLGIAGRAGQNDRRTYNRTADDHCRSGPKK